MSRSWQWGFRLLYRLLGLLDPLLRAWYRAFGLGNVIELRVVSRRTGHPRSVLLGLLSSGGQLYLGHPNGESGWTCDMVAAGGAELVWREAPPVAFTPARLAPGPEREAAILATTQHPFPGNLIYRLARGHVRAAGVYFRLEPLATRGTA